MIFTRFALFFLCLWLGFVPENRADLTVVQSLENLQGDEPAGKERVAMQVSGRRIRLDQGQGFSSIILGERKVTFSISHEARKYIVLAHDLVDAPKEDAGDSLANMDIKPTGVTEMIGSFSCRQVRLTAPGGEITDLWMSDDALDMGSFMKEFKSFMEFGRSTSPKELEKHPELKGVPIRVVEYRKGKPVRRSTIVQLSTAKVAAESFEVPAGYSEMKASDFSSLPPMEPKPSAAPSKK